MLEILNCTACQAVNKLPGGCSPTPGKGGKHPIFMFVVEKSDILSASLNEPLMDIDGDFLKRMLKELEISKNEVYFTSLVKCIDYSNKSAKTCSQWLTKEIEELQPKYIVAMGKNVTDFFLSNVALYTNSIFQVVDNVLVAPSLYKLLNGSSKDINKFKKKIKELYDISKNRKNR
jgi:uracil-DNA glycosylase family 4